MRNKYCAHYWLIGTIIWNKDNAKDKAKKEAGVYNESWYGGCITFNLYRCLGYEFQKEKVKKRAFFWEIKFLGHSWKMEGVLYLRNNYWFITLGIIWTAIFAGMSFYWAMGGMLGVRSLGGAIYEMSLNPEP
ncbi:hypothetical protein [Salicibibacter halophilus]|uniref:hypothetical protein n=1 Tax=Salicibibacter halophilus TaxID=2502791 RepID=UPI001D03952B|nr:hypothetical protein [Salicibibacter halophilus]